MRVQLSFPTPLHQRAAEVIRAFCAAQPLVDTVLIVNSCARGHATPTSDLDMAVLVDPAMTVEMLGALEARWLQFRAEQPEVLTFTRSHPFAQVHLDYFTGEMADTRWDDGGGPDSFEVEIGNRIAYAATLGQAGARFRQLQASWLPYYAEDLRRQRLTMAGAACAYDLEHVPFFVGRRLYFQAFDRLYKAFQEFLQALFIARRTYPLAYNKWIREQVEDGLGLPELYRELPGLISVRDIAGPELNDKAAALSTLLEKWTGSPGVAGV